MRRYLLLLYSLLLSLIPLGSMAQKASENVLSFTTPKEPGKKISLIIVAEEPVIMDGLKDTVTAPWWFDSVSYTHLDVYKRQVLLRRAS